ncbi:MAG TPA: hypothetical protein VFK05_11385 [Polyangiaceae bacterium]|nr:hypothetical protein [Polyangiaceae bacterium]
MLRALVLLGLGGVWAAACGGPQPLGAAGSVCFRADDCQAGLACVPEAPESEKRICSADLSGIVSMVDGAAPEAGDMPEATGGAPATPQGGSPATGGALSPSAGGKPAAAGAPSGTAGASSSSGGSAVGGAPAAGAPSAGAPSAGGSAAGAAAGGENGGETAGTGG